MRTVGALGQLVLPAVPGRAGDLGSEPTALCPDCAGQRRRSRRHGTGRRRQPRLLGEEAPNTTSAWPAHFGAGYEPRRTRRLVGHDATRDIARRRPVDRAIVDRW
jgi:hypothetical protein